MSIGEKTLLDEVYNGETLVDIQQDVDDAMDSCGVPVDHNGFATGSFRITLVWTPDP